MFGYNYSLFLEEKRRIDFFLTRKIDKFHNIYTCTNSESHYVKDNLYKIKIKKLTDP
jgi:hypothetical protein